MRILATLAILGALVAGGMWLTRPKEAPATPLQIAEPPAHFRSHSYRLGDHLTLIVADVPDVLSPQLADRCFILEDDSNPVRQNQMQCLNGVSAGGQ